MPKILRFSEILTLGIEVVKYSPRTNLECVKIVRDDGCGFKEDGQEWTRALYFSQ